MRLAMKALFVGMVSLAVAVQAHSQGRDESSSAVHARTDRNIPNVDTLLFDDEFDGNQLDLAKWYRCYTWCDESQGGSYGPPYDLEWMWKYNVSVSGGMLNLTAKKNDGGHEYTSGVITTGGSPSTPATFAFQYGYMEMSARFPAGKGMWPAFWLLPSDGSWPPEIDTVEWLGNTPMTDYVTIHWGVEHNGHHPSSQRAYDTGDDLSAGFHTYGVDWQADHVTWYFDGKAIKNFTKVDAIPHKPMYIIVNLAVGGWIAPPDKSDHFPATMLVDYVRVWSQKP
ncbi:MAG: glycoside hydrolase family 16 protein [Terriglobales bacterium]